MINLFIAVILEQYDDNSQELEREEELKPVYAWREAWLRRHPSAPKHITARQFYEILLRSPAPAGFLPEGTDVGRKSYVVDEEGDLEATAQPTKGRETRKGSVPTTLRH